MLMLKSVVKAVLKDTLQMLYFAFVEPISFVDHNILLFELEYYGICGMCNDWLKTYLLDCKQFVSINGYNSYLMSIN